MTINDYFKNYKKNSKFPFSLKTINCETIEDFYNDFIAQIYSDTKIVENIINWHNMLVEYCNNTNNIYWVRQYESGGSNSNDNRRASLVEFEDGLKILYVSNYDAQEVLNMAVTGVMPDLKEFEKLMNNHDYFFHYSTSCVENNTNSYPNRLDARKCGVLTQANYYLAHIRPVNDMPYYMNGISYDTRAKKDKTLHDKLYPKGIECDYNIGNPNQIDRVYKPGYSLNNEEKSIIKAHFLRFVDPLNYFPIPGVNNHVYEYNNGSAAYKNIGEFPLLISYMYEKTQLIFNSINFDIFDQLTCFDKAELNKNIPNTVVNVSVRAPKKYSLKSKKTNSNSNKKGINDSKKVVHDKFGESSLSASKTKILFNHFNEAAFKKELLIKRKAKIKWIYSDGSVKECLWDAKNMSKNSSVRGNIQSRKEWRKKDITGLLSVELELI